MIDDILVLICIGMVFLWVILGSIAFLLSPLRFVIHLN